MKPARARRSPHPIIVLWRTSEVADMLHVPKSLLDRLIALRIHPAYVWKRHWSEPRWTDAALYQWAGIVADIDLDTIPDDPGPMVNPARAFQRHVTPSPRRPTRRRSEPEVTLPVHISEILLDLLPTAHAACR